MIIVCKDSINIRLLRNFHIIHLLKQRWCISHLVFHWWIPVRDFRFRIDCRWSHWNFFTNEQIKNYWLFWLVVYVSWDWPFKEIKWRNFHISFNPKLAPWFRHRVQGSNPPAGHKSEIHKKNSWNVVSESSLRPFELFSSKTFKRDKILKTYFVNKQNFFLMCLNSSTLFPHMRWQLTENTGMNVCVFVHTAKMCSTPHR